MKLSEIGCRSCFSLLIALALLGGMTVETVIAQETQEKQEDQEEQGDQEKTEPEDVADPFEIPDGTPEELIEFVEGLKQLSPKANDKKSILEFRTKISETLVAVADKLLASKGDDQQMAAAIQYLLNGLVMQKALEVKGAKERLEQLPDEVKKSGHEKLVRPTERFLLKLRFRSAATGGSDKMNELIDDVVAFVSKGPVTMPDAQLAMSTAIMTERGNDPKVSAADCYLNLSKALSTSDEPSIVQLSVKMKGAARRVGLMGKEMPIEGVDLEGNAFDSADYKGKVVLVQYWATWCRYCLTEMENTLEYYNHYHDKGFEVVAISIDQDRERLEKYLADNEMPWVVLVDQERKDDPKLEPMGTVYGVFGVPNLIMLDKEGKVFSLKSRGKALGENLEKLLGPIETEEEETEEEETEAKKAKKES